MIMVESSSEDKLLRSILDSAGDLSKAGNDADRDTLVKMSKMIQRDYKNVTIRSVDPALMNVFFEYGNKGTRMQMLADVRKNGTLDITSQSMVPTKRVNRKKSTRVH